MLPTQLHSGEPECKKILIGANISSGHNLPPPPVRLFTKKMAGTSPYVPISLPEALSLNCRRGYHQIQLILVKSIIVKLE